MVDAKHLGREGGFPYWDSNQRFLMEVSSSDSAAKRRVHFKTEKTKSKSLETPYHHTHQQQKLNIEMDDIQERSYSYSAIPQVAVVAPSPTYSTSSYYLSQLNNYQNNFTNTDPNRLSHAHAERMLRYRQRSFSADDLSPSSAEHEKWEREANGDQIWRYNRDNNSSYGSKLDMAPMHHVRAPMLSGPQRSFSAGDLSPSCEKWERESSERINEKADHVGRNARITFMKEKLNVVQSSYPVDIKTGQPGHSWGEIMAQLPSGRHTIEKAKRQVREATLKEPDYGTKLTKQKVSESQEPEHRTRHKDKDDKVDKKQDISDKKLSKRSSNISHVPSEKVDMDAEGHKQGATTFSRYRSYTLIEKKQHADLHKETAGRRISAPVKMMNPGIPGGRERDRRDSKSGKGPLIRQKDIDSAMRSTPQKISSSRSLVKKAPAEVSPASLKKGHPSRKHEDIDIVKSRDSVSSKEGSSRRVSRSGAVPKGSSSRSNQKRDVRDEREKSEKIRERSQYSQQTTTTQYSSSDHSTGIRTASTQMAPPRVDIYRERSPGAYSHSSSVPSQPTYPRENRPILHDSSLPVNIGREMRRDTSSSIVHQGSVQPESSPKHVRVRRPRTLVRQKEINAHIRPMDYRGTQEHIKQKRQLMLEQRKSHSFESSFEDHFFHDLKYNGVDLKELKNSAKESGEKISVQASDAATKRLIMVRDRKDRKSNSLDSSFEVVNENEVFYDAPSSFIQDLEKSPKLDASAKQKRMQQFKEQKSYSYECPTVMEKFHTKTHARVEDLRNSDPCYTRPRRELPVEPGSPSRRRSSGSPRSPQSRGSPHSPRSPSSRGSPHSPRSPSGRGSPRSPQGYGSPHSPRSPSHVSPHSPKTHQRKVSPKSSLSCSKDVAVGCSRDRSPSVSHSSREQSTGYTRERYPSGDNKERSPSSSRTHSRERTHVSPHSSREQSLHRSREQALNESGSFYRSPFSSRENSSREASRGSLSQSKGSLTQSREQPSIKHSRDRSPYQSHEQSLAGSRELIAHRQFRDISPRGSNEQSLSLSRDMSPKTSRDRLNYSRDSNHQSKEHIARSREHSPYHSREFSQYPSQGDMNRSSASNELIPRSKETSSYDSIKASSTHSRRECFQQQKSYSIDLPPSHDPYVEQERQVVEQNVSYVTSIRYEGLAPLKEYRESIDSHDEKSLQGYPSPIAQRKDKSPNRRQQFKQQKSYSLDLPFVVREPTLSETEPVESKSMRSSTESPSNQQEMLMPVSSDVRRMHLLKQKSKSIDVPYQPTEAKEYLAKILERRSYDHASKREYSKDFDAQLKRVMMARRAMTVDYHIEDKQAPTTVIPQPIIPKAHKMRTFREQKSYSIDVPDKSAYEPEYSVRRERSPSQGQAQRPVVTFREPRTNAAQSNNLSIVVVPNNSENGSIQKISPSDINTQTKQKRNVLKTQKSYSLDIPIAQIQRQTPEVMAADSGIGASSDRTLDLVPDIHIEPNITVLDPESPPQVHVCTEKEGEGTRSKKLGQYGKQKSYSIDVPPSVGNYYYHYDPESFDDPRIGDANHLNVSNAWRQKREDYFQHQKSYSVDVPSAEMGNSPPEYKLPERKVESDSKILVRLPEKRPTHKRLQFLRYLTEQGTFSFDDGGKPIAPLDLPNMRKSDSSKSIRSGSGSNASLSSQEKLVSQSSLSSNVQSANKNRRKSLFALHNMKPLADIPHSGESGESSGMGLADETTLLLCDSGVVFDEPLTKEVVIASVSSDKIAHCDNKDIHSASCSSSQGCTNSGGNMTATESNTELKGILKNKDDPIYIKEKDKETSWKWKLFACAEFLADRRADQTGHQLLGNNQLDDIVFGNTGDGAEVKSPLSPLSEELRRYILYNDETSGFRENPMNQWLFSGSTRSPGSRRRKRLTHNMKSFSVDCQDSTSKAVPEDKTAQRKSVTTASGTGGSSSSTTSPSLSTGARSSFSFSRFLQSFVHAPVSGNTAVTTKRGRFFGRQSSSLDTAEVVYDNHNSQTSTGSSTPPWSGSKPTSRTGSTTELSSNSPKIPRRLLGNVFVALFNYKPREKDDLEIKAGSRVITLDTSNPDWWKGKCNSRIGYFPSNYVTKLNPGDRAMQVVSGLEVMEGEESIKLLKDQIVIQEGMAEEGMVLLRTAENKRIPCPLKYLTDVEIPK